MNETPENPDHVRSVPGTPYSVLARVARLARKELREILRDRRTIITLIAMPVLLYPLMSVLFVQFSLTNRELTKPMPKYRVAVMTAAEADVLHSRIELGKQVLDRQRPKPDGQKEKKNKAAPPEIQIVRDHINAEPRTERERRQVLENFTQLLHVNELDLVAVIPMATLEPRQPARDRALPCQIFLLSNTPNARDALDYLELLLAAANEEDLKARLNLPDVAPRITILTLERVVIEVSAGDNVLSLSALVPLVLILMTITGAVYPAIDLTAGERERGTLEILVAAPVPRFELLTAKYISVVTVAVLNAIVNLVCMTITVKWSGASALLPGLQEFSFTLIIEVFALLLLFALFFSAVLLCLTSFARSFKEAQAYLIPLMLASLAPGIMAMMPGLTLGGVLTVLPLVNIVLMARDLFETGVEPVTGTIVVVTTLLYALAALSLAARVFGAESVLYSEQSSWSDLVRRPDEPQKTASITSMMWCLALMVPIHFAVLAVMRSFTDLRPMTVIVLGVAINLLLFGVLPAIFVIVGRVKLPTGLGLALPRPAALLAGFLLGVSLWPLELRILSESAPIKMLEERFGPVMQAFRLAQERLGWGVLVIVIVPAIMEEIYFRGLLFNALKARCNALVTIGVSGVLFGVTHIIMDGALGLERLVPTMVLGLILGAVCWQSGSLWPSVIQHVCHNAILMIVGLQNPGSVTEISWTWIAAGGLGTLIGGLLLWYAGGAPTEQVRS